MSHGHDRQPLIDTTHAVDIGLGYSLAYAVDGDGELWPVVCDQRQRTPQWVPLTPRDFVDLVPHEMTGPLPAAFQQFYCEARARSTGRRCRARVPAPGQRCRHHPVTEPAMPTATVAPGTRVGASEQLAIDLTGPEATDQDGGSPS